MLPALAILLAGATWYRSNDNKMLSDAELHTN